MCRAHPRQAGTVVVHLKSHVLLEMIGILIGEGTKETREGLMAEAKRMKDGSEIAEIGTKRFLPRFLCREFV